MTLRQINFGTHYFSVFFLHVQKWTLSKGPSLACSRHAWMQWWISPHLSNSESDVVWWILLAHQPWKNKLYHPVPSFKTQGVRSSGTLIVHSGPLMVPMAMVLLACGSLKRAWGRTRGPLEEGALSVECFDEVWAEQRDCKNDVFGCWWCCSLGCFLANAFLLPVFVRHVEDSCMIPSKSCLLLRTSVGSQVPSKRSCYLMNTQDLRAETISSKVILLLQLQKDFMLEGPLIPNWKPFFKIYANQ